MTPGVMETYGASSASMQNLVQILARNIKGRTMIPVAVATKMVRERISLALYVENARMIKNAEFALGLAFEETESIRV